MNNSLLTALKWPAAAIAIFILINLIFFAPQLGGKQMALGDLESYKGMVQEAKTFEEETGRFPLWTNSMFGGMPTFQIGAPQKTNLIFYLNRASKLFISRPIGYWIAAMLGFYIMLLVLKVRQEIAIIGAILFAFSSNNFILFETGHSSKLMAIFYSPWIIAGVITTFKKNYLVGGILFALGVGLNLFVNHFQMTYYLFISLAIYGLLELYQHIRQNQMADFGKAVGVLLIALAIGFGSSASKLWTTYEYSKSTMRGQPILQDKSNREAASSSETEGLAWDYAMQWSNGLDDLSAGIIPRIAGGGSQEVVSGSEAIAQLRRRAQSLPANMPTPLYHGSLPFTSGPVYFGALVCFLFIFSLFVLKGPVKWWLLIGTLLTFLLSLGKHFEFFNALFFDYLPFYNKFRAPSSVLSVTVLFLPLAAALGLSSILKEKTDAKKLMQYLMYSAGITGGFCLLIALLGPSMFDVNSPSDPAYQQRGWDIASVLEDRRSTIMSDGFRSFAIILLGAIAIWAWIKKKISSSILLAALGLIGIVDLWGIGKRYITKSDFVEPKNLDRSFDPRPVDLQILQDQTLHYRVHDLTSDFWSNSRPSYHHRTIGGYHAAKLQRIQDIYDRYLSKNNTAVLSMLNTKYLIVPGQNNQPQVQQNPEANGNAWFVNSALMVPDAEAEISAIGNTDLANVAIIHEEYKDQVPTTTFQKNGSIELQEYVPDRLTYRSNSTSDQFAVFSEVWYGPNKGWKAYIDGVEAPIMRTNYLLRGLNIPAGEHEILFEFKPKSYSVGEMISLVSSLVILLGLIFLLYNGVKSINAKEAIEEVTKTANVPPSAKSKRKIKGKKKR